MRRRIVRPFGASITPARGASMLAGLVILWMLYNATKAPETWVWMTNTSNRENVPGVNPVVSSAAEETILPGPNGTSDDEWASFQSKAALVRDRAVLMRREMPAYWQLMAWCRSESFSTMFERAKPEPNYTELWEVPEQFRGTPLRLRLNVRRVLEYDAPQNDVGVTQVYEAWGWTENSRSFPFVVVMSEKPSELPVGPTVEAQVEFTGYFLKNMAYSTVGRQLAAPLLVGKARLSMGSLTTQKPTARISGTRVALLLLAAIPAVVAIPFLMSRYRRRSRGSSNMPPFANESMELGSPRLETTNAEPDFDLNLKL